jgi:hypothetical protein
VDSPDTGHFPQLSSVCTRPYSYGWVRSTCPTHSGKDERAWGRGKPCGDRHRPDHRDSLTEEDTARAAVQKTRTGIARQLARGRDTAKRNRLRGAQASCWQGSHEAATCGRYFRAARRQRCSARIRRWWVARSATRTGKQQVGQSDACSSHATGRSDGIAKGPEGYTHATGFRRNRHCGGKSGQARMTG